jgi:hypothetical protein
MKMTKEMQAQATKLFLAQAADAAAPYRTLANEIAVLAGARSKVSEKATEIKEGLWGAFRSALDIGLSESHSADNIAVGLTVACEEAGVPGGSSRSYIGTIRNMYAEIVAGSLSREDALLMKINDARQRYMDADKRALKEARERLAEATKDWTVAQLDEYTALATADNDARRAEAEAAKEEQKRVVNG